MWKKQTNVETCGNLVTICKNTKQNTKPPTETDVCASTLLHHSCVAVHNIIMFLVYFLYIHLWMKALNVNIYWIFKCYGQQSKNPFKNSQALLVDCFSSALLLFICFSFFLFSFTYLFIFEFFNILFSWRDDRMLKIDFLNDCGPVSGIQTSLLIITR